MPKQLLLVDDDPNVQMMLGDFLIGSGYEVSVASSGEEALRMMTESLPDLVLLDMGMPGMGGTGFLERITDRHGYTRVPVLVLTARSDMAEYFADKKIAGFMTKPADPDELAAEIQRILFTESDLPHGDTMIVGDDVQRLLVLAEPNAIRANALREALGKAGFSAEIVRTGGEAVEAVVSRHPAGLVIPLDAVGMGAEDVIGMLRRLPSFRALPAVVYDAEKRPAALPLLDKRGTAVIEGNEGAAIAQAALRTIV